ncbi:MAG: LytTR family DNA-binding domain-containing protein [Longicatena sp.]
MKIAICDDDEKDINHITNLLNTYRTKKNIELNFDVFINATDLLSIVNVVHYNLILLDIVMPGFNGLQAAKEIRSSENDVPIVFLTSSPDFAVDSYSVKARDYILKPISKNKLFSTLDSLIKEESNAIPTIAIKTQSSLIQLAYNKIIYVEVMNKHLYFHLTDGSVRKFSASLSEYEKQLLEQPEFMKVHRSYIVNFAHMSELTTNSFFSQNGNVIPVSRLLYSDIRKEFMNYLFEETTRL